MAKFSSRAVSEHAEVPLADGGRWEELVDHWSARKGSTEGSAEGGVFVVSVGTSRDPVAREAQLVEMVALVKSQGGWVAGTEIRHLGELNPRTFVGSGTARELAARARECGATMLVLDAELTPSQMRNLEDVAGIPICDREAIILNVFLRHARTRRAKVQVEIAQLEYLRPRIRGVGLDMDQQTGGTTKARGPGETASELLARKLDGRLEELRKALRKLDTSSDIQRGRRRAGGDCARIALVGYTNAGKTSLMNALTAAELSARDVPFETLDTTSRCLTRHGGEVLVSDTVGFIRNFPERLFESFASTLAELAEASLLVIVLDASDHERELQLRTTVDMLARLGVAGVPRFYVFTKRDRLVAAPDEAELSAWSEGHPRSLLSTHDTAAVATLAEALIASARRDQPARTLFVPYAAKDILSDVYASCRVVDSVAAPLGLRLSIEGPAPAVSRIRRSLKERSR